MALVMLLTQLAPPGSRAASLSTTGRWSSTGDLGVVGTHAVLLREPQSNAAKVFLFGSSAAFALHPAAPNPTRGTVRLAFDLPQRASARLEIFDSQGRLIRRLEGEYAPGRQAFEWDLRHARGPRVAPGVYSYRLTAGAYRAQRKLVVLP